MLRNFGIVLTAACGTTNAGNLVFAPVKLPTLAAMAAATKAPQFWDCGDVPGTQDYTLTPSDRATVNALLAQMNAHIEQQAEARGWAHFRLGALFEAPGVRVPYNALQQFTSPDQPYGPFISLDGYHPSAAGQTLLAQAAARALNDRYGMKIPTMMEMVLAGN
jgi:lysophospholipase L1-like esterase